MSMVMFYYLDCSVPGTKFRINGATLVKWFSIYIGGKVSLGVLLGLWNLFLRGWEQEGRSKIISSFPICICPSWAPTPLLSPLPRKKAVLWYILVFIALVLSSKVLLPVTGKSSHLCVHSSLPCVCTRPRLPFHAVMRCLCWESRHCFRD